MIRKAIEKYGEEWFDKTVLFVFETEEEMNAKEKEIVTPEFCALPSNYNLCPGGQGGFGYINKNNLQNTEERKISYMKNFEKLKIACLEWHSVPENRIALAELRHAKLKEKFPEGTWKGRTHSEETKRKMSIGRAITSKGEKNSQYGSFWITNNIDNRKMKRNEEIPSGWIRGRMTKKDI